MWRFKRALAGFAILILAATISACPGPCGCGGDCDGGPPLAEKAGVDRTRLVVRLTEEEVAAFAASHVAVQLDRVFPGVSAQGPAGASDEEIQLRGSLARTYVVTRKDGGAHRQFTYDALGDLTQGQVDDVWMITAAEGVTPVERAIVSSAVVDGSQAWRWHQRATRSADLIEMLIASGSSLFQTPGSLPNGIPLPVIAVIDSGVTLGPSTSLIPGTLAGCSVFSAQLLQTTLAPVDVPASLAPYDPLNLHDASGHGTLVAALACEASGGLARIVSVPALDANNQGTSEALAAAIQWAAPDGQPPADFINLSLGFQAASSETPPLHLVQALQWAADRGAQLVASSGNLCGIAQDSCQSFWPAALTVTAGSPAGSAAGERRMWSIGGVGPTGEPTSYMSQANLAVYAPASHLLIGTGGGPSCSVRDGTSFAAPQVAGAAALLWSASRVSQPTSAANTTTVLSAVVSSAAALKQSPSCGVPGEQPRPGRLDVCAAWSALGLGGECGPAQEVPSAVADCPESGERWEIGQKLTQSSAGPTWAELLELPKVKGKSCRRVGTDGHGFRDLSTGGELSWNGTATVLTLNDLKAGSVDFFLILDCDGPPPEVIALSSLPSTCSGDILEPFEVVITGNLPPTCGAYAEIEDVKLLATECDESAPNIQSLILND